MEASYEQILQLENVQAHLKVVQGNIRTANEELVNLNSKISSERELLRNLNKEKELILNEYSDTVNRYKKTDIVVYGNKKKIGLLESTIANASEEYQNLLKDTSKELSRKEASISELKNNKNELIDIYSTIILDLNSKIISLNEIVDRKENEKMVASEEAREIELKVDALKNEYQNIKNNLAKFKEESDKEIARIAIVIEEEKDKIRNPLGLLGREVEKLEVLKNDLAIIKMRLTHQFKRQNPDKLLPIELQEKEYEQK